MSLVVLAIDPGSLNYGLAVVRFGKEDKGEVLAREIVEQDKLEDRLRKLAEQFEPDITAIGSGTRNRYAAELADRLGLQDIRIVDEKNSTMEARYRYLQENPGPWYIRIIPKSLRLPREHCDDWAAVILAERIGRG